MLWAFSNSKLLGTTHVKDYKLWGDGGYRADDIYFNVVDSFKKDPSSYSLIYITVPPGTAPQDQPRGFLPAKIPEEEEQKLLLRLGQADPNAPPDATPTVTATPTCTLPPTATFTPTITPTFTVLQKADNFVKALWPKPGLVQSAPNYAGFGSTPGPQITPTPDATPWEEKIKSAEVLISLDLPEEGLEILEVNCPWDNAIKLVYSIHGRIEDSHELQYVDGISAFDQAFQVMGKKYLVFHADSGTEDELYVYRIDSGRFVKVAYSSVSYD